MEFIQFCAAHGVIVNDAPPIGRWCRYPTDDHPRKRNGAVKYMGDVGWVQNHATMPEPATWFPESKDDIRIDHAKARSLREQAARDIAKERAEAARKAAWIISQSRLEEHAYLDSKGFKDKGLVWLPEEGKNLLVIPMRVSGDVVGCQLIDRDGNKKFLYGQRCSGAEFVIGNSGVDIWCEGYATGLSIHACLKKQARIHICFSAGNMAALAKTGFIVADNDESGTGEDSAKKTGLPYFMSDRVGEDFNDMHRRLGKFKAARLLLEAMQ